ncbi:MAG TPA: hypothetical protein PKM41_04205 [Deltaproteobacteria bacterium]|jgi:molybdenum cofactor biosynthesis enzyme MoaA|nr:hypothetical protein [Deltaproteobacteria bacterium]HOI06117.1 hypothetical protein [Deltaproteobacteria bacterium]
MCEAKKEVYWWDDEEIFNLIARVAKAGKLDMVKRKLEKIHIAVENGADVGKINEFVMRGRFNGRNVDELIEQAR